MNKRSRSPSIKLSLVIALIAAILAVGLTGTIFSIVGIIYPTDHPLLFFGIAIPFTVILSWKLIPMVQEVVREKPDKGVGEIEA
jgi:hypothetical protein